MERTQLGGERADRARQGASIRDIGDSRLDTAPVGSHRGRRRVKPPSVNVDGGDDCPLGRGVDSRGSTDTAAGARDEHD